MNNIIVEVGRAHAARPSGEEEQHRIPAADVYETPEAFVLLLDIPGTTRESISLTIEQGEMRVRAGVKKELREGGALLFNEIQGAGFFRAFSIGDGIDTERVDAAFEHGVLTVKLFKSEDVKPRQIQIN